MMIEKQQYLSYSALGRKPTLFGIPYMAGMSIGSTTLLVTVIVGDLYGLAFLFPLVFGFAILLFIKHICETDAHGVEVFILELKWRFLRYYKGNTHLFGGTMTIFPVTYGRLKHKDANEAIKKLS